MMITRLSDDITYKKVGQSYAMLTVCMCVCVFCVCQQNHSKKLRIYFH